MTKKVNYFIPETKNASWSMNLAWFIDSHTFFTNFRPFFTLLRPQFLRCPPPLLHHHFPQFLRKSCMAFKVVFSSRINWLQTFDVRPFCESLFFFSKIVFPISPLCSFFIFSSLLSFLLTELRMCFKRVEFNYDGWMDWTDDAGLLINSQP